MAALFNPKLLIAEIRLLVLWPLNVFVEDELGRIKKLLTATGTTDVEFYYDADDRLQRREQHAGPKANAAHVAATDFSYDGLDRITATLDAMGGITATDHDGSGEAATVTDAGGNATTYLRDGFGDVILQQSPDTGTTQFWYNAFGLVTQQIDARSKVSTYRYDALGRRTAEEYPTDTTLNVGYLYDQTSVQGETSYGIGRLAAALRSNANEYYTYDDRGNLLADIHSINTINYSTRYSYNVASQLLSMTYPSGRVITYQRDSAGRIAQISVQDGVSGTPVTLVSGATYQAFGPLTGFTYGNSIKHTRVYGQDGRLTDITDKYSTTTYQNLSYGYDWAGNIETLSNKKTTAKSQTLSYDDLARLLTAQGTYGAQTFTYDEVGNRLSGKTVSGATTTLDTFTPAATSNRITTMQRKINTGTPTTKTFTYDSAGNTTADFERTALTYNAANRLKTAKKGTVTMQFGYNAMGQRVVKWNTAAASGAVHFHYDQRGQLIGETSATGTTQRDYIWLEDMPVAILTGALGATTNNYVHSNHLNAPQLITSATRASSWTGDYQPFGTVTKSGTFVNNLRFPGQYFDTETGLHYNYFRDNDPVTGRYVESDPIGLRGGINTYAYVLGNPIRYVDPLGLANGDIWTQTDLDRHNTGDASVYPASTNNACVQRCVSEEIEVCAGLSAPGSRRVSAADIAIPAACAIIVVMHCSAQAADCGHRDTSCEVQE